MKIWKNSADQLVFLVGITSIVTFLAASQSINAFKFISVILQLLIIVTTVNLLVRYQRIINWPRTWFLTIIFAVYPLLHIILTSVFSFEFKKITDGLFLAAPYYQLSFVALVIAAYLKIYEKSLCVIIEQYLVIILPIILILAFFGFYNLSSNLVGDIYNIYNNFFIPSFTLLFFRTSSRKRILMLGIFLLMLTFVMVQGSRSYLLVILYFTFFSTFAMSPTRRLIIFSLVTLVIILFAAFVPSFTDLRTVGMDDLTITTKFDTKESLSEVLRAVIQTGEIERLYYWEGNSRAKILDDAFYNFSLMDIIFGRSIFGIYESFVHRNTIEVGWAQEAFWFGFIYVGIKFILIFFSWRWLKKQYKNNNNPYLYFLQSIIVIRFLDGWVYGMPTFDVYNLIFFLALMSCCIKNKQSVAGNQSFLASYTPPRNNSINNRIATLMQAKD